MKRDRVDFATRVVICTADATRLSGFARLLSLIRPFHLERGRGKGSSLTSSSIIIVVIYIDPNIITTCTSLCLLPVLLYNQHPTISSNSRPSIWKPRRALP
jgi:hypothetical protein